MNNPARIKRILVAILLLNWLVALLKVIFGYKINSLSMTADGYHSFSDGLSNIIGLAGITIAFKPKDENHPYGHKKYETFASIVIAIILFVISFHIVHDALDRFKHPLAAQVSAAGFAVMLFTMAVNTIVMSYEYKMGRRLNSDILVSDSLHTRSDILTSFSVIIALLSARAGYPLVEPIASLVISLFIAYSGFSILSFSSKVLCDTAIVEAKSIQDIVKAIKGVIDCHDIRTRGRCDDIHIDLHVTVEPDMHIDQADRLGDIIEQEIKSKINGVTDVVAHMEPRRE